MILLDLANAQNHAIHGESFQGQESYFDIEALLGMVPRAPTLRKVVDLGGGNGVISCQVAASLGLRVVCVEKDPTRFRIARQNVFLAGLDDQVSVMLADMDCLDLQAIGLFDGLVAMDTLQHSMDLRLLLRRLARVPEQPFIVATVWCCDDEGLAERWGIRSYASARVGAWFRELRPDATVRICDSFAERVTRYLGFLEREAERLGRAIGEASYLERRDLLRATCSATRDGSFGQLFLFDEGRHRRLLS